MAVIDGLVSYWALDEGSGNATDAHGSNTLTDNNTVGAASGKVAGDRDFEVTNSEYFSHADNASLSTGDIDFSFGLWVQIKAAASSGMVIAKDVDTPANSRDYTIDIDSGTPRFYINGGGGGLLVSWGATLTHSVWCYLACGHSASANELWISINAGTPVTASTSGTAPQDSGAEFRMGARAYASSEFYLNGYLDEAGFWKRDIRSSVSWLYNSGSGRSYADIVAEAGTTAPLPVFMNQYRQRWR